MFSISELGKPDSTGAQGSPELEKDISLASPDPRPVC